MLEKIALKIAEWLLRFAPDWMICAESTYGKLCHLANEGKAIEKQANGLVKTAELLIEENKQIRAAYDALLEEFAQLTEERTW